MADPPSKTFLRQSLAALALAASAILCSPAAASPPIEAARALHDQGKALTARRDLVRLAGRAAERAERLAALEALLDLCIAGYADDCIAEHTPAYLAAAKGLVEAAGPGRPLLIRKAAYYLDVSRNAAASPAEAGQILEWAGWTTDDPADVEYYLRRQRLGVDILMRLDRHAEVDHALGKILSLVASLKNPQADRALVAGALSHAMLTLGEIGETERAYGLYIASGAAIAEALPPLGVDAVVYRLTEAQLLQEVGDLPGSLKALDAALAALDRMELDPGLRDWLLGSALTLKSAACTARLDKACAQEALARHPLAGLYERPGRTPRSRDEVGYLTVRALSGIAEARGDPVVAQALAAPVKLPVSAATADQVEVYRAAGLALAIPAGPARQAALAGLGRTLVEAERRRPPGAFGAWRRLGLVDAVVVALALTQADDVEPEIAFALVQLAGRVGPHFDADALATLGQARTESERRGVHQALRLRARRDRYERAEVRAVLAGAGKAAHPDAVLAYDVPTRLIFRAFADRIEGSVEGLAKAGVPLSGANLVPLARFQAALAPNEVALTVTPVPGGLAHVCVRRDAMVAKVAAADLGQMQLDTRIVQQALTAGHTPSEALDSQYPAAASVRLYDVLIRPFAACLKPGNRILWLPGVTGPELPLAALLASAPPKLGEGYDLAQADWLVRRHAVAYAGSAAVIVAARAGHAGPADFDFLGVGDPVLAGGSELASLPPLPETRPELEASARGFRTARLLMGAEATEARFRDQLVGSYRYLSFATHGLIRDDPQGLSEPALVLTPASGRPTDDGLLTAPEIADLTLRARFVALSACNTANFDLTRFSQDLPALASAFAVAGAPATLATLWPVDSETSRRVVSGAFERLGAEAGLGPADVLAEAQRAFLAAPPGRAWLHPRFWAPFVILGDGGAAPEPPAKDRITVASVDVLTRQGGEVIALTRTGDGVAARFIGDKGPDGRYAAGLRLAADNGTETWRREGREGGAAKFLAQLGPSLVADGYRQDDGGVFAPTLEAFEPRTGRPVKAWTGASAEGISAFVFAGAKIGPRQAIIAVGEPEPYKRERPARLRLLQVDEGLAPRELSVSEAPIWASITHATVTPLGDALLVTYTDHNAAPKPPERMGDEYQQPLCGTEPVTWVELRDAATGALRAAKVGRGLAIITATRDDGRVLLGGSFKAGCTGEARAVVLAVDAGMALTPVYRDETPGGSEVRALGSLGGGRTFVAAHKEVVVDYRPAVPEARRDPYALEALPLYFSGMFLTLGPDGAASSVAMLDTGGNVFVSAVVANGPRGVLVGGSLGGQAAIIRLEAP